MGFSDKLSPDVPGMDKRTSPLNWIIVFLVVLIGLSLAGLLLLQCCFSLEKDSFGREVGIVLLQLIAVGVLGTVSSLLLARYTSWQQQVLVAQQRKAEESQREQERIRAAQWQAEKEERSRAEKAREAQRIVLENKNVLKKSIIKRLGQLYHETKGARRMLRAKVLSLPYNEKNISIANIYLKPYAQYLEVINDLQLELENINEEIKPGAENLALFANGEQLYKGLKSMEDYLRSVFKEYETSKDKFNERAYAAYIDFPLLNDFLSSAREESRSGFRLAFINEYKKVMADMLRELVNVE